MTRNEFNDFLDYLERAECKVSYSQGLEVPVGDDWEELFELPGHWYFDDIAEDSFQVVDLTDFPEIEKCYNLAERL